MRWSVVRPCFCSHHCSSRAALPISFINTGRRSCGTGCGWVCSAPPTRWWAHPCAPDSFPYPNQHFGD
ncbi:hypothetical protein GH722_00040 [Alphaproteobacteria bacterium HT1-32]|nr:hypothetical protein [Alphaproteobacteria bacterium HT1-32]